jgi:hypothetical protein
MRFDRVNMKKIQFPTLSYNEFLKETLKKVLDCGFWIEEKDQEMGQRKWHN